MAEAGGRGRDGQTILQELSITDERHIGTGCQGEVYCGNWGGRLVAIMTSSCEHRDEMKNLRKLRHQNIVQLLGVGLWRSKFTILLEYCSRGSLAKVLRSEDHIFWILWIKWLREIADGMYYLHGQKIIHCDLNPDNVLVADDNVIRIAGFGSSVEKQLTEPSVMDVAGTYRYMAPEMIRSDLCSNKLWHGAVGNAVSKGTLRGTQ